MVVGKKNLEGSKLIVISNGHTFVVTPSSFPRVIHSKRLVVLGNKQILFDILKKRSSVVMEKDKLTFLVGSEVLSVFGDAGSDPIWQFSPTLIGGPSRLRAVPRWVFRCLPHRAEIGPPNMAGCRQEGYSFAKSTSYDGFRFYTGILSSINRPLSRQGILGRGMGMLNGVFGSLVKQAPYSRFINYIVGVAGYRGSYLHNLVTSRGRRTIKSMLFYRKKNTDSAS